VSDEDARTDGGTAGADDSITDAVRDRTDSVTIPTIGGRERVLGTVVRSLGQTQLSAFVAGLAALVTLALVGQALFGRRLALIALTAGVTLALGLYALNSQRMHVLLGGGALLVPAGILVTGALATSVVFALGSGNALGHLAEVTALLLIVGGFAAVVTAVPLGEHEVIGGAFLRFVALLVPIFVLLLLVVIAAAPLEVAVFLANLVLDSPDPLLDIARTLLAPRGPEALLTFLVYVLGLFYLARTLIGTLPIVTLFPPQRRAEIASHVENIRTQLGRVLLVLGALSLAGFIGALYYDMASPAALSAALPGPLDALLFQLLTVTAVRAVFVTLLGAMGAVIVAERLRRRVRRLSEADVLRLSMPPLGAAITGFVAAFAFSAVTTPGQLLARLPAGAASAASDILRYGIVPTTLLLVFGSVIALGIFFVAFTFTINLPFVPDRALGAALASGAVFGVTLVLVLFGGSPALAFVAAVAAMIVWDAGEFAAGLREELGVDAVTARGELVHVGGALVVGLLVLLVTVGLQLLVGSGLTVPTDPDTTLAAGGLTLAFLVTIVLVAALRD